jgi:hypothetical protein
MTEVVLESIWGVVFLFVSYIRDIDRQNIHAYVSATPTPVQRCQSRKGNPAQASQAGLMA